jgi:GMP synthase-like glutamine amidotransferase
MSAARLLVMQPDTSDPVGPLGSWFEEAGALLDIRKLPDDHLPDQLDGYDGVVCLGGGMNAEDDRGHPWLADVRRVLARAVSAGTATLGICLGAQLLTVATGGRVVRGAKGPEVGPGLVSKKDAAWTDPLFAELPLMQDVLQFHQDAIDTLPPGATLLASAPKYQNQAFRVHRRGYGIQFHIETTPAAVRSWAADSPELAEQARPGVFELEALIAAHDEIAETWRPFAHRFVQLAEGSLAPAEQQRPGLPFLQ